jgi:2'-5' RNA ligase
MSIRAFIAIEIPDGIRRELARLQDRLRRSGVRVRWVSTDTMHLTVKFLGDVPDTDIPAICEAMKKVAARVKPFELEVTSLGAFPPRGAPRVLWAGLEGDVEVLAKLVGDMNEAILDAIGLEPEHRRFHAHLTLGRVKSTKGVESLTEEMRAAAPVQSGRFGVDEMVLFMSELRHEGARHTPMATVPFSA